MRVGVFAALMAICSWISLPVGHMALTMQTFGILLALGVLGGKWGSVSIGVYLLLGAAGLPVFSGFRGGLGHLLGVTGGYLWGFLFTGLVYWSAEKWGRLPAMVLGLGVCYLCGSVWFLQFTDGGLGLILLQCVAPYIIPDAFKLWLALTVTKRILPHLKA